jgi:hypothetical protein
MVKRRQHIGTFFHNEMGISLRGMSPMCGRSSIHLQKIFFLRSIDSIDGHTPNILGAIIELDAVINRGGVIGEFNPIIRLTTMRPDDRWEVCEIDISTQLAPHQRVLP